MARFNEALAGTEFPIDIHIAADPTWESYEAFMKGLKVSVTDEDAGNI